MEVARRGAAQREVAEEAKRREEARKLAEEAKLALAPPPKPQVPSTTQPAVGVYVPPDGAILLSEGQIRERFIENTLTGKTSGTTWYEYYKPNGSVRGQFGSVAKYRAKWSVSGSVMCWDFKGTENDGCYTVSANGDTIQFYDLKGKKFRGRRKLLSGNPKNL